MSDDSRLASIVGEWQARLDRGEHVDPEAVIAEHPDLADALREQLRALSQLRHAKAGKDATRLRTVPLDRYGEFQPAGEGGMGLVYWAIDTDLNREVAFKVIRPSTDGSATTPAAPGMGSPVKGLPSLASADTLYRASLRAPQAT